MITTQLSFKGTGAAVSSIIHIHSKVISCDLHQAQLPPASPQTARVNYSTPGYLQIPDLSDSLSSSSLSGSVLFARLLHKRSLPLHARCKPILRLWFDNSQKAAPKTEKTNRDRFPPWKHWHQGPFYPSISAPMMHCIVLGAFSATFHCAAWHILSPLLRLPAWPPLCFIFPLSLPRLRESSLQTRWCFI